MTDPTAQLATIPVAGTAGILGAKVDGKAIAAFRPIVEMLGMAYSAQLQKLKSKSWAVVSKFDTTGADGKTYEMVGVGRKTLTMYLATLDENRVKEEVRPILVALQTEAADALDAYFHEGGAINPAATVDQLERLTIQSERQMWIVRLADGIIDSKHLEAKARVILARAMGETPELDPASIPLYVSDYLKSKGLASDMIAAKASGFGRRLKGLYVAEHGDAPRKAHQELPNGTVREVYAYTQVDRDLFDRIWIGHYEGVTRAAS
ncbi:phage antirepressor N-terminal domain-containing protein [Rhodococcus qingshengii]|uniref:phage antirepressor N-terminal domain-containing protein n=1 Tax=Rhodococcus qingshengii TaxID=334542 RepID=UPI0036DE3744